jgi:hypothetical protein
MHTTAAQLDEKEDVEPLQPDRLDREEIHGQQALAVCPDELLPCHLSALTHRAEARGPKPPAHGRRRHRDAKTLQLADDPWISPPPVLSGEPQYELHSRATKRRCQHSSVAGVTMKVRQRKRFDMVSAEENRRTAWVLTAPAWLKQACFGASQRRRFGRKLDALHQQNPLRQLTY